MIDVQGEHSWRDSLTREEQLHFALFLCQHGREQANAVGGRTDAGSVVEQKLGILELHGRNTESC